MIGQTYIFHIFDIIIRYCRVVPKALVWCYWGVVGKLMWRSCGISI